MSRRYNDPPNYVMDNIFDMQAERMARLITQEQLCEITGVNLRTLQSVENIYSYPTPMTYNRLARYFGWKIWQI